MVPARTCVRKVKNMEITWLGHACFQLRGKNATLITDPFTSQSGETPQLGKASIVTISHNHPEHNNVLAVSGNPRAVRGPGEYEISDILITGVADARASKPGQERGKNTVYVIHMDDIALCHLGRLDHTLEEEQLEEVADADVLFLPIGGSGVINPAQAAEVISQIEPRIVIPMLYNPVPGEAGSALDKFYREMSIEGLVPQMKLNVTRSNLPAEIQFVVFTPKAF
jgi:L-ascorbate metabolism protein UlaG (beta-lactamase superfamily)